MFQKLKIKRYNQMLSRKPSTVHHFPAFFLLSLMVVLYCGILVLVRFNILNFLQG